MGLHGSAWGPTCKPESESIESMLLKLSWRLMPPSSPPDVRTCTQKAGCQGMEYDAEHGALKRSLRYNKTARSYSMGSV